jgi:hypothetical protein
VQRPYPAGEHLVQVDLAAIAQKASAHPLDLSDVEAVQSFIDCPEEVRTISLHRIWLEKGGAGGVILSADFTQGARARPDSGRLDAQLLVHPHVEVRQRLVTLAVESDVALMLEAPAGDEDRQVVRSKRGRTGCRCCCPRRRPSGPGACRLPP